MNRLILVRHGENPANLSKEMSCRRVDYPLTEKGRMQAEQTAAFLSERGIDRIVCSPLKRAKETAAALARRAGLGVAILDEFREVDVGELEGDPDIARTWQIHGEIVAAWLAGDETKRFPGGESMTELKARFVRGIAAAIAGSADGETIAIVGHGGIFTFSVPEICDVGDRLAFYRNDSGNCAVSEFDVEMREGAPRAVLLSWASTAHLSGPAADLVSGLPEGYGSR